MFVTELEHSGKSYESRQSLYDISSNLNNSLASFFSHAGRIKTLHKNFIAGSTWQMSIKGSPGGYIRLCREC